MRKIAELNVLLRERIDLPGRLKLATEEFRDGWRFARTATAQGLEQKIHCSGWNFIKVSNGSLRSGVGDTSQEAIARGLELALRHVDTQFNAAEVDQIELTHYPWFVLARVKILPYLIQVGADAPAFDELSPLLELPPRKRTSIGSPDLYPHFGCAMPQLKQMLIASATARGGLE